MKISLKILTFTLLLFISVNAYAEQKVVIFDLKYALNNSKAGKGAQDYLKKSFEDSAKKFTKMDEELKKEEQDLLAKKTILSKEEYSQKIDALRKKVIDYQSTRRKALEKISNQRTESRATLIKKIDPILNNYIKENNISLVIDKKSTLGGNPDNDITKFIIDKLNKELPSLNLK
jgi:Skp family chaperone for outer membrane proteins|tara:strand:- start:232 stop:756 length:525 start_codon:yes stop_codon:yes gene_type:complete